MELRNKGKYLFVASNSHKEYVDLVMTASLGLHWEELFNIVICYCRKPTFFKKHQPFYEVIKDGMYKGTEIKHPDELYYSRKYNFRYTEGNANLLTEYLKRDLKKNDLRVCYFGDNYH